MTFHLIFLLTCIVSCFGFVLFASAFSFSSKTKNKKGGLDSFFTEMVELCGSKWWASAFSFIIKTNQIKTKICVGMLFFLGGLWTGLSLCAVLSLACVASLAVCTLPETGAALRGVQYRKTED